jgi:hypothetical protein
LKGRLDSDDQQRRNVMKPNLGPSDKTARVIVGLALLTLVLIGPKTAWGWIGLVLLLTAWAGCCPFYRLLGIDTSVKNRRT